MFSRYLTSLSVGHCNVPSALVHIVNKGTSPCLVIEDEASDSTPLVVDASGNVGIGLSNPSFKVEVVGDLTATTLRQGGATLASLFASSNHVHDTSSITTGTLPVARGGTGTTASTGTGSNVLSAGPTFTGTVTAATINATTLQQGGTAVSVFGHTHDASNITTGTLPVARGGTGVTTSTGTGNNVLSAGPAFTGTVTAATINATTLQQGGTAVALSGHTHDASAISSGTLAVARGGTGTTSSTGSGNNVLSAGPTLTGTTVAADIQAYNHVMRGANYGTTGMKIWSYDNVSWDLRINFQIDATVYGYVGNSGPANTRLNFTGQHKCFHSLPGSNLSDYRGLLVSSTGNYMLLDHSTTPTINEALPIVRLTCKPDDPACFGVVSGLEDSDTYKFNQGSFVTVVPKASEGDTPLIVNSVGEGGIWVCDANGPLDNGDYLTSSQVRGYATRQTSKSLFNHTVAKITCDCGFDDALVPAKHPQMRFETYEEEVEDYDETEVKSSRVQYDSTKKIYVKRVHTYVDKRPKKKVVDVYDDVDQVVDQHEVPAMRMATKRRNVMDLDSNMEMQWVDVTDENGNVVVRPKYEMRYLDEAGNVIDKTTYEAYKQANKPAYKASFVGCIYCF